MPSIDWPARIADAVVHLQKPGRKATPEAFCEIIDDVVDDKLSAADIAAKHGGRDPVMAALGHVTTAFQGGDRVKPFADGGWYQFRGIDQPYAVEPSCAAAWKAARA